MFAKKARSLNYSRGLGLRRMAAAVRPCNDNQPVRLIAPRQRKRRPLLLCHWQRMATGRLECHWSSTTPDLSDEGISCLADQERTWLSRAVMSALCQKRTLEPYSITSTALASSVDGTARENDSA